MSTLELQRFRNVVQHYGPRERREDMGGRVPQDIVKVARWEFNWNQLPSPGTNNLQQVIPAGSTILSAKFRVISAFTSTSTTTDLTVGLQQADGTQIDNDGLLTAAHLTQTTIAVVGAVYDGSSGTAAALINRTIGANPGELVVAPSVNDLLSGRGEVFVEYLVPGQ